MVFIIDDTQREWIEQRFHADDYSDVLTMIPDFTSWDVKDLSNADCVMIHSSYHDAAVRKRVSTQICNFGEQIPLVWFSDGDLPEAEFDDDCKNYIIAYSKSEMYAKLPVFLREYRRKGTIDLDILAKGESAVADRKSFDGVIVMVADGSLAEVANEIGAVQVDPPTKDVRSERQVHDYMVSVTRPDMGCLILSFGIDPGIMLDLAMHVRLSAEQIGAGSLCPIVFVSDSPLSDFLSYGQSQILLTDSVYLFTPGEIVAQLDSIRPLSQESYRSSFLSRISIRRPDGSNHSLANQWGASRLFRIVSGREITSDEYKDFHDVQKELYYKYVMNKVSRLSSGPSYACNEKITNAAARKVLLIDDEADKGWAKTMEKVFTSSAFDPVKDVICEKVADYSSLSPEARNLIENGDYDLFLLDLRLNGEMEDGETETRKMSGYDVLKKIKESNHGNQVIMLTASNKAWNLKALLNPTEGASGYFVKESPEYEFSDAFSVANLESFRDDASRCFDRVYLRRFWSFMEDIRIHSEGLDCGAFAKDVLEEIHSQMKVAFGLCSQADSPEAFQYAYLSTFQVLETLISHYVVEAYDKGSGQKKLHLLEPRNQQTPCLEVRRDSQRFMYHLNPNAVFTTSKDHKVFGQRDKLAVLYLQKWGQHDNGLIHLLEQLILCRNDLIHKNGQSRLQGLRRLLFTDLLSYRDINDNTLIYSDPGIYEALNDACSRGCIYDNGHIVLHPKVADGRAGVMLMLNCLEIIVPLIWR